MLFTNQAHVSQNYKNKILLSKIPYDACHKKKTKTCSRKRILKCYTGYSSRVSEVENITFLNFFKNTLKNKLLSQS